MKKIVCLIPLYNEQEVLGALFLRLGALFDSLCARYEMSALLVDDGSADGSLALLREQHARDGRFRYLSLSRNFGKEAAMMAGFDALGTADAVIVLDADLQDPPELIPQMLELFEQGYDDVYARRRSRAGESAVKRLTSHLYYRVLGMAERGADTAGHGRFPPAIASLCGSFAKTAGNAALHEKPVFLGRLPENGALL